MIFRKSEIEKVKKHYGENKGSLFLTVYNTYITRIMLRADCGQGKDAASATSLFIETLKKKYGMSFVLEYNSFFKTNLRNIKLQEELKKTGEKYIDNTLSDSIHKDNSASVLQRSSQEEISLLSDILDITPEELTPIESLSIISVSLCDKNLKNQYSLKHLSSPLMAVDSLALLSFTYRSLFIHECKNADLASKITELYFSEVVLLISTLLDRDPDDISQQFNDRIGLFEREFCSAAGSEVMQRLFESFVRLILWERTQEEYEPIIGYPPFVLEGIDIEYEYRESILPWLEKSLTSVKDIMTGVKNYVAGLTYERSELESTDEDSREDTKSFEKRDEIITINDVFDLFDYIGYCVHITAPGLRLWRSDNQYYLNYPTERNDVRIDLKLIDYEGMPKEFSTVPEIFGVITLPTGSSNSLVLDNSFFVPNASNLMHLQSMPQCEKWDYCILQDSSIRLTGIKRASRTAELIIPSMIDGHIVSEVGGLASSGFSWNDIVISLHIPDTVKRINSYAFSHCHSLKNVHLGANVSTIGEDAFFDCENLSDVSISSDNKYLSIENNSVFAIENNRRKRVIGRLKKTNS